MEKETEYKVVTEHQPQSTALTVDQAITVGNMMAKSGYFDDARQAAQAVVKILAGREMGFGPFAAMTGISIIKGKPVITANLMAAAVRAHPRYNYKIIILNDEVCELAFYRDGAEAGKSTFTAKDAISAEVGKLVAPGAAGNMMKRFPRNMLFARAMSNGVKWYCPDVFLGAAVYTPGELPSEGTVVDGECTEIVVEGPDGERVETPAHWANDEQNRKVFWVWAKQQSLSSDDVHRLSGFESIRDFPGDMTNLKAIIMAAIQAETEAAKTKAEHIADLTGEEVPA